VFSDRRAAGEALGDRLRGERDPVVIGIARGGVIVAEAVARVLTAPLDVLVIRKVGHPLQPELALGAVAASGRSVTTHYASEFDPELLRALFAQQIERARALEASLRDGPSIDINGKTAILVDDGIATSATMSCAIEHARATGASRVVCAAAVSPADSAQTLAALCDSIVVLVLSRDRDFAVGRFYIDFREVDDGQVRAALERAKQQP